jgi:arabinoxylan arabinofuranohydrolase
MKTNNVLFIVVLFILGMACTGCPTDDSGPEGPESPPLVEEKLADPPAEAELFNGVALKTPFKKYGNRNPVMGQWFGADPWALVYNDRVYLYLSDDHYPGYGNLADLPSNIPTADNDYAALTSVHVISSADLVNWTDHGLIKAAGSGGIAQWASQAFAPAAACKNIDGQDWFFLYVGNNANGVYVLKGDKPTPDGNWTDPNGTTLVNRSTPGCDNPKWCFDPAVLIDDDGSAYLYFGGGVNNPPDQIIADPDTARVVKLKANMTERDGNVVHIEDVPYLLEDFGINKINGQYYFSYCSSSYHPEGRTSINYLTGSNPMGPFATTEPIFRTDVADRAVESKLMMKNPLAFNMRFTNNHHAMFKFKGNYYMAYQTVELEDERARVLGYAVTDSEGLMVAPEGKQGYRSASLDKVTIKADGSITPVRMTLKGVAQEGTHDPYAKTEAETIGVQGGITTDTSPQASGGMAVTGINTGGWIALYGVDFGTTGASKFKCRVMPPETGKALIQIRDGLNGESFGYALIEPGANGWQDITSGLLKRAKGVKDLVFVFYGQGWEFDSWKFEE